MLLYVYCIIQWFTSVIVRDTGDGLGKGECKKGYMRGTQYGYEDMGDVKMYHG